MFGMGIFEILVILIVAVIFLGPEKLPQAMIDVVKFFKAVKKTLNDAKDTFDKELQISEIKKEAIEYKSHFEANVSGITKDIQLKEIDEMYNEYKEENQTGKAIKDPKLQAPIQAIAYEDSKPKKRGRKPKVQKTDEVEEKKSVSKKTKKDSDSDTSRNVVPKKGKSTGFKRTAKTSKES